mgnify:CR=1 FL=1
MFEDFYTQDGDQVPLSEIPYEAENVIESEPMTKDYKGGRITHAGEALERAIPAEQDNRGSPSIITFDLTGLEAVSIEASVAVDYPVGDARERRRGLIARQTGESARFLSVIEPHQGESVVESVTAEDAETLTVELTDGRVHQFKITGLDSQDGDIQVSMTVMRYGKPITAETTGE